jgi:hypothetical protein
MRPLSLPLSPPQPQQHGWTVFPPKCNHTSISLELISPLELFCYFILAVRLSSISTHRENHDDVSPGSLVHHHGLICAQRTTDRPSDIHRPVRHRRSDNARRGVHDQRPVGSEPGQRRRYASQETLCTSPNCY